jgi:hypothetical protein
MTPESYRDRRLSAGERKARGLMHYRDQNGQD